MILPAFAATLRVWWVRGRILTCIRFILGLGLALTTAALAHAAALDVYGGLPSIEAASISPDGRRLAFVATDGEERVITLRSLADGSTHAMIVGDAKVRALDWAGPTDLLITTSTTSGIQGVFAPRSEYFLLFAYDVESGELRNVLGEVQRGLTIIVDQPAIRELDGRPFVFVSGIRFSSTGHGRLALFSFDPERSRLALVKDGFRDTRGWLVGPQGEAYAQTEYDVGAGRWRLRVARGSKWDEVLTEETLLDPPRMLGFGRTTDSVLLAGYGQDQTAFREFYPDERRWGEVISGGDSRPIWDPSRHTLIGVSHRRGDEVAYEFFEPEDQRAWDAIVRAFPGERVSLSGWSDDRNKIVVLVDSPTEGPGYALVDLETKKATWIGQLYRGLKPEDISPVRSVAFKAADGLALTAYLTVPRGREAKNLPLVVLPHGGPAARDSLAFDWWAQALASRGYAVLQVNFRGSSGFGDPFMAAGYGEWGGKMQTDLSDGVAHLADQGVIDPARVCIVGGSYGGYAALAGVTVQSGVYRCAASVGGISDLRRLAGWLKSQKGALVQRQWFRYMGSDDAGDPKLRDRSPVLLADRVTAPVLLVHGEDDTVVPFEQSSGMSEALRKAGKPVELVTLPGEDHFLSRGETRRRMLQSVVRFLETHNPP